MLLSLSFGGGWNSHNLPNILLLLPLPKALFILYGLLLVDYLLE